MDPPTEILTEKPKCVKVRKAPLKFLCRICNKYFPIHIQWLNRICDNCRPIASFECKRCHDVFNSSDEGINGICKRCKRFMSEEDIHKETLDLIRRKNIEVNPMIAHALHLDECGEAPEFLITNLVTELDLKHDIKNEIKSKLPSRSSCKTAKAAKIALRIAELKRDNDFLLKHRPELDLSQYEPEEMDRIRDEIKASLMSDNLERINQLNEEWDEEVKRDQEKKAQIREERKLKRLRQRDIELGKRKRNK